MSPSLSTSFSSHHSLAHDHCCWLQTGAEDVVHSTSGSDGPESPLGLDGPARSNETPSVLNDEAFLKARLAAKAALRGMFSSC
jgi:hypothetical protein